MSTKVTQKTRMLNEEPDKVMLAKLRVLEKKMGLVMTLVRPSVIDVLVFQLTYPEQFKASVWGVINDQPDTAPNAGNDPNDTTIRH